MLASKQKKLPGAHAVSLNLTALIEKIQVGDRSALEDFYDATVKKVYSSAMRITGNAADAEDVTCEVYLRLWHTAQRYDARLGNPSQWIMVIVRNCALDCLRQRRRSNTAIGMASLNQSALSSPPVLPEQEMLHAEMASLIQDEMSKLPILQARVVRFAFFEGLSHSEISNLTQLPLGTVKSQISRALKGLRRMLRALGPMYAFIEFND